MTNLTSLNQTHHDATTLEVTSELEEQDYKKDAVLELDGEEEYLEMHAKEWVKPCPSHATDETVDVISTGAEKKAAAQGDVFHFDAATLSVESGDTIETVKQHISAQSLGQWGSEPIIDIGDLPDGFTFGDSSYLQATEIPGVMAGPFNGFWDTLPPDFQASPALQDSSLDQYGRPIAGYDNPYDVTLNYDGLIDVYYAPTA